MNVLIVGSGGREHAICRAFRKSGRVEKVYCANGNAGIAEIAECVAIKPDDIAGLAAFAEENNVDLTFVGGETALAAGIVDEFEARRLRIFGPTKSAAELEASKSFAKQHMSRHGVPTAAYAVANSPAEAVAVLESGKFGDEATPVVVKADGLAAGKGVVVAADLAEAIAAVNEMAALVGADAAETIVLEECLVGKEVSLLMFASGEQYALMPAVRDHKRIGEGNTGPNTGGLGTFTDDSLLTADELAEIEAAIVVPSLKGSVADGYPFRGILFIGLMMTADGPRVLEYNVRFGDPETQSVLVRLETDIADICDAVLDGTIGDLAIEWRQGSSACVVLAAANYPAKPIVGDTIFGINAAESLDNVTVFQAGTARNTDGELITAGGRVLGVTAVGNSLDDALRDAYAAVDRISFAGMQFRRDIGR
ncbi:MAG: phosphoribosylamine--glycine ligase [Acidobacteriota bacterium]|nr:MAG: phosphoribosylamine--glycine ligase [Acidobacteriota bacterium]